MRARPVFLISLCLGCGTGSAPSSELPTDGPAFSADAAAGPLPGDAAIATDGAGGAQGDSTAPTDGPAPSDAPLLGDASGGDRAPDTRPPDTAAIDGPAADAPPITCAPKTAWPRFKAYRIGAANEPGFVTRRPFLGLVGSSPRLLVTVRPASHLLVPQALSDLEAAWDDTALEGPPSTYVREGFGFALGSGGAARGLCGDDLSGSTAKRLSFFEWSGVTGEAPRVEPVNADSESWGTAFTVDASGQPHVAYLAADHTVHHAQRDPGGWVSETVAKVVGGLNRSGLAIAAAPDGRIAIAFGGAQQATVMIRTAGVWSVDNAADWRYAISPALVFDQRGALHFLYLDTSKGIRWSMRDGLGWRPTTDLADGLLTRASHTSGQIALAMAPDGQLHAGVSLDLLFRYLRYDGCKWSDGPVDVPKTPGRPEELELPSALAMSPSLAFDDAGRPHLAAVYYTSIFSGYKDGTYYYLRALDAPAP